MAPRKSPQTGPIVTVIPIELSKLRTTAATRGSPGPMAHTLATAWSPEPGYLVLLDQREVKRPVTTPLECEFWKSCALPAGLAPGS